MVDVEEVGGRKEEKGQKVQEEREGTGREEARREHIEKEAAKMAGRKEPGIGDEAGNEIREEIGNEINEVKVKEYLTLREEVVDSLKVQNTWTTFTISAAITLLGIAIGMEHTVPELFLLPFVVLFLASLKVNNLKRNTTIKVGYMITRLEAPDGFLWESCLNRFRRLEKENRNRRQKLAVFLETQEFTILGMLCMALFSAVVYFEDLYGPRYLAEFLVCIPVLAVIAFTSTDYWNINYKEVDELRNVWEGIVEEVEAGRRG